MTNEALDIPAGRIERVLQDGWVDRWLVIGPYAASEAPQLPDFLTQTPVEGGTVKSGNAKTLGIWQLVPCMEDRLIHLGVSGLAVDRTQGEPQAWLCTIIQSEQAGPARLMIEHTQPIEVWLNGARVEAAAPVESKIQGLVETTLDVEWQAGQNEIRLFTRAPQAGRWATGMRIEGQDNLTVVLPTALQPLTRREELAEILDQAYVEQDIFHAQERIYLKWPATSSYADNLAVRLQATNRRIYTEGHIEVAAGAEIPVARPEAVPEGRYDLVLMPKPEEFYQEEMRITRRIPIYTVNNTHSTNYYGDYALRAQEALEDANRRQGLFAEIAKMALGRLDRLRENTLEEAIAIIQAQGPTWRWQLLGVVGMYIRFGAATEFPLAWREAAIDCIKGHAAQAIGAPTGQEDTLREDEGLAAATIAVLAGGLASDAAFENVQSDLNTLRKQGEQTALEWLRMRAAWGFSLWDSPLAFERIIAGLSHLVDLSGHEELGEMAAVVLDKLFLTLGINSFQGIFGSAHAETTAKMLLGYGTDATSGAARLAWGKGTFNAHILGTVSLACATGYELPEVIAATAVDSATTLSHRERHAVVQPDGSHLEIHKTTHRTPSGILCSVQDYRAGEPGQAEHIWQASLGSGATVFVNHPAFAADVPNPGLSDFEEDPVNSDLSAGPGFWRGNAVLPRVAQADDILAAWYRLAPDDRMGFTHAYFPQVAFDEYYITDHWAFGRKGTGYIALYASTGLTASSTGAGAYRELRAQGTDILWLCRLGSEAQDGSFVDFRARAEAAAITLTAGRVDAHGLWGRDLSFGWEGPLLISQPIAGTDAYTEEAPGTEGLTVQIEWPLRHELHYESEFCRATFPAESLEVNYKGHALRLDVG